MNKTVDLVDVFDKLKIENEQYLDLIFEFVTKNNLEDKFAEFLDQSIEQENYVMLDLEHMLLDYK